MSERTTGPRRALSVPAVYALFQDVVGAQSSRRAFLGEYVRPRDGERILDIGCGPAQVLEHLPESCPYTGFDLSAAYIDTARKRWGARGEFFCAAVDAAALDRLAPADVVLAMGILHHLDDDQARGLFALARRALRPGGRLVTFDGAFTPGQSPIARWLLRNDRGRHVRTPESYQSLARETFPHVEIHVRHDLIRIPYTHAILVAGGNGIG